MTTGQKKKKKKRTHTQNRKQDLLAVRSVKERNFIYLSQGKHILENQEKDTEFCLTYGAHPVDLQTFGQARMRGPR